MERGRNVDFIRAKAALKSVFQFLSKVQILSEGLHD